MKCVLVRFEASGDYSRLRGFDSQTIHFISVDPSEVVRSDFFCDTNLEPLPFVRLFSNLALVKNIRQLAMG